VFLPVFHAFKQEYVVNQQPIEFVFPFQNTNSDMSSHLCRKFRHYRRNFGLFSCSKFIMRLIPILTWLPKYQWRKNFPSDLMAGFTVGVMHVPQGKAENLRRGALEPSNNF